MFNNELEIIPEEIIVGEPVQTYLWMQMAGEPELWFFRFVNYFLPLGGGRNLLQACILGKITEDPSRLEEYKLARKQSSDPEWSKKAHEWRWIERAQAYDAFQYQEALASVADARIKILKNAAAAAEALIDSLKSPRLAVAAAKEILDRAGLPATTVVQHQITPYSADEYSSAAEEVRAWEAQMRQPPKPIEPNS